MLISRNGNDSRRDRESHAKISGLFEQSKVLPEGYPRREMEDLAISSAEFEVAAEGLVIFSGVPRPVSRLVKEGYP